MEIDSNTVGKIAKLARLKLTDVQVERMQKELSHIMKWVEQLKEVDTRGIEPLTSQNLTSTSLRTDEITEGNQADKIVSNAPEAQFEMFVVPKVVE